MPGMMVIIIPLGTIFSARRIAEWIQQNRVVTVGFQHEMNSALRPLGQDAGGYADVGEYRRVAGLDDRVHGVEAEPVETVTVEPVQNVLDHEGAHLANTKIDGGAPRCLRVGREKF